MSDLVFVPHAGNAADFLIVTEDTPPLRARMVALGATVRERPGHTVYSWRFPAGDVLFGGNAVLDGRFVIGPCALATPPGSVGAGTCCVIELGPGETRIRTDPFGLQPLFHGANLVTNRLHLAALAVGKLDTTAALAIVHSDNTFCEQFGVVRTPVAGVSLLLVHERLSVGDRVRVESEPLDDLYELRSPAEYQKLIARGAEEVLESVRALLDAGCHVSSAITGGRDSRVILGALVALGRVRDVSFRTQDIGRDLDLGTGLVNRYGGSYQSNLEQDYLTYTLEERDVGRRSQIFGAYHLLKPAHLAKVIAAPRVHHIAMNGGCGELYREFYQKAFPPEFSSSPYTREGVSRMLREHGYWSSICQSHFDRTAPRYLETFDSLPGRTISEKLDSHYLNFRNRFHFGASATLPIARHDIHPMASPSLLAAARGLPASEKATGRVLFDVTRALCEELPYLAYDNPWTTDFTLSPYHVPSRYDGKTIEVVPARDLSRPAPRTTRVEKPRAEPFDFRDYSSARAMALLKELQCGGGPFAYLANEALERRLRWAYEKHKRCLSTWCSRLQAFRDYDETLSA